MSYLYLILLLALIVLCGDVFLRGVLGLSAKLKIPFFLLGATVVAMGTSSPDLFVSVSSVLKNNQDIMFGSLIGSATANIFLCIGLACLIYKIPCEKNDKTTQFSILYNTLFAILFCIFLVYTRGKIGIIFSIFLIFSFIFFIICVLKASNANSTFEEDEKKTILYIDLILFTSGITGLLFFSDLLVQLIINISVEKEIETKIISASIVSIGNSIPEIITSILAAFKKRTKIILGNVIGSNIFIISGIIGITSLVYNIYTKSTINVSLHILRFDLPIFLFASILLILIFKIKSHFSKITGLIFIFIYLLYTLLQFNII